jgi:hypothetical protein
MAITRGGRNRRGAAGGAGTEAAGSSQATTVHRWPSGDREVRRTSGSASRASQRPRLVPAGIRDGGGPRRRRTGGVRWRRGWARRRDVGWRWLGRARARVRLIRGAAQEFVPWAAQTPKTGRRRTPAESRRRTEQRPDGLCGGLGQGHDGWWTGPAGWSEWVGAAWEPEGAWADFAKELRGWKRTLAVGLKRLLGRKRRNKKIKERGFLYFQNLFSGKE